MDAVVRCLLALVLLRYARQEASMRRLIDCATLGIAVLLLTLLCAACIAPAQPLGTILGR